MKSQLKERTALLNKQPDSLWKSVPEDTGTLEPAQMFAVYAAAVKQNGKMLQFVPKELRTPEICAAAVKKNGDALEFVPERLKTPELCLDAVQKSSAAMTFVPFSFRNEVEMRLHPEAAECIQTGGSDPLKAACAAFSAYAERMPLPEDCSLAMEAARLKLGRIGLRISFSDPERRFYAPGMEPYASATYPAKENGMPADPAACLRAFAHKLEGRTKWPVKTMPDGMKRFCTEAVYRAAEAAEACAMQADRQTEDREEEGIRPWL